ncbi:MAG: hypothetical protein JXA75_06460, partial [Candidatus Thermoplasmatota archaeon]|nr:hypothetical protein [Candidatus Thermoplasmatota archaeon]
GLSEFESESLAPKAKRMDQATLQAQAYTVKQHTVFKNSYGLQKTHFQQNRTRQQKKEFSSTPLPLFQHPVSFTSNKNLLPSPYLS